MAFWLRGERGDYRYIPTKESVFHEQPLLALLLTAIVLGGSLTVCFWPSQDSREDPFSVTGTVTGLSPYCSGYLGLTDAEIDGLIERLCS